MTRYLTVQWGGPGPEPSPVGVEIPDGTQLVTTDDEVATLTTLQAAGWVRRASGPIEQAGRLARGDAPLSPEWDGLLLEGIATELTADPRRFRWDDKSKLMVRLNKAFTETPGDGQDYTLAIDYSADGTTYATTIRSYTGGAVGPSSHLDTHRLYRANGSYLEWTDPGPRIYTPEESSAIGRERRARTVDRLIGQLRGAVEGGGGDPVALLAQLNAPTPTADPGVYGPSVVSLFVDVGSPDALLQATQAALPAPLYTVVADALAPWVTV